MKALHLCWQDFAGRQALTVHWLPDDVTSVTDIRVTTLIDSLQACSYAHLFAASLLLPATFSGVPAVGPYDCLDLAELRFSSTSPDEDELIVAIPAPRSSVFDSSTEHVNTGASIVVTLATSVAAVCLTASGFSTTSLETGLRDRYDS